MATDGDKATRAADILARSYEDWAGERLSAIESMRTLVQSDSSVFARLCVLLDDQVVTVQVEAAEMLVEEGGQPGLSRGPRLPRRE